MQSHAKRLWSDECGMVLSAEMILVLTIGVMSIMVGLNTAASAINQELGDLAKAFGTMDQTFFVNGFHAAGHSGIDGSGFIDRQDFCDGTPIVPDPPEIGVNGTSERLF